MKKFLLLALVCGAMLLVGCGKSDSQWYDAKGAYINLQNVDKITTECTITFTNYDSNFNRILSSTIIDGPITKENIKEAYKNLKSLIKVLEKEPAKFKGINVSGGAAIKFDGYTMKLANPKFSKIEEIDDIEDLVESCFDTWLEVVEDLEDRLN